MSVPASVTTRTVVFTYLDPAGKPVKGYLLFTPTVTSVVAGADTFLTLAPVKVTLDVDGAGSAVLACTDDPDVTPAGWAWVVEEFIPGGRRRDNAYYVQVPVALADGAGLTDLPGATPAAFTLPGTVVGGGGGGTGDLTKAQADGYYEPLGTAATGLAGHVAASDPHPQYETSAEAAAKIAAHQSASDPHAQYETSAEVDAKLTAHTAAGDPHPQYLTQTEGDARYSQVSTSGITKDQADTYYDPIGSADASMSTHLAAGDPHPQYETATEGASRITAHSTASDPHGDRAYADAQLTGKAAAVHSHATGDITSLAEFVRDTLGATLVAGSGITVAVDDGADTVTISGSTIDAEQVQDIVGAMVAAGGNISATYNDSTGVLTIAVTGLGGAAALNVGTTAGTVAAGDDARLSDSRTPTAHASSHGSGGSDALTLAQSQVTGLSTALAGKETSGAAAAAVGAHEAAGDPHPQYETSAEAAAKITAHEAAGNPHPGYLTQAEGDALYAGIAAQRPAGTAWVYLTAPVSPTEPYLLLLDNGDGTYTWQIETGIPAAPTALAGTRGDTQVALTWSAPSNLGLGSLTYTVERSSDAGATWGNAVTGLTGTSTTITGLTNGTSYLFRVKAVTSYGSSAWNTSSAAVPATTPSAPAAPTGTAGSASVALTWSAPANGGSAITGYTVQRATNDTFTENAVTLATGIVGTSYTNNAANGNAPVNGTTYYYRVRATNAVGDSAYSSASAAQTPASAGGTYEFLASAGYSTQKINTTPAGGGSAAATDVAYFFDGDFDNIYQAFLEFDTSSVPDGETITSATLEIAGGSVAGVDAAGTVEVFAFDFGTFNAASDYRTPNTSGTLHALFTGGKRVATRSFNSSGSDWPNATTRVTYTNDGGNLIANISKTGPTRFVIGLAAMRTDDALPTQYLGIVLTGTYAARLTVVTS